MHEISTTHSIQMAHEKEITSTTNDTQQNQLHDKVAVLLPLNHPGVRQLSLLAKLAKLPQINLGVSAFDPATIGSLSERDVDRAIVSLRDSLAHLLRRKRQIQGHQNAASRSPRII